MKNNANNNTSNQVGINNDDVDNNGNDEEDDNVTNTTTSLSPEMIAAHVSFINECTIQSVRVDISKNVDENIQD